MTMIPTLDVFAREPTINRIRQIVLKFHELGGALIFGTDTRFLPDYDMNEEYRQLAEAGLSFRNVLAMLTTNPAGQFGFAKQEGTIVRGNNDDLTILNLDPAADGFKAFTSVRYTVHAGRGVFSSSQ